jgi:hypothetical protein
LVSAICSAQLSIAKQRQWQLISQLHCLLLYARLQLFVHCNHVIECCHPQVEEFELPKASTVCSLVILSYFLVTAGIAYDIINEPPAVGAVQDEATGAAYCLQESH